MWLKLELLRFCGHEARARTPLLYFENFLIIPGSLNLHVIILNVSLEFEFESNHSNSMHRYLGLGTYKRIPDHLGTIKFYIVPGLFSLPLERS